MSNFFRRLAQRTLGNSDAVRPLIPSRYADAAPDTMPEEVVSDAGMAKDQSDRQGVSAPAAVPNHPVHGDKEILPRPTPAPAPAKGPATADTNGLPRQPDHDSVGEPMSVTVQVAAKNDAEPRPQQPTRVSVAPPGDLPHARRTGRQVSTDDAQRDPWRADPEQRVPEHQQVPDPGETGTARQTAPFEVARRSRHPPHRNVEAGILPAPIPDEGRQAAHARHDRADPAPRAPAGDPVVEVHIGRIEVYAAQPPVPAASEAPTSRRLSLADYLDMRDGGRR